MSKFGWKGLENTLTHLFVILSVGVLTLFSVLLLLMGLLEYELKHFSNIQFLSRIFFGVELEAKAFQKFQTGTETHFVFEGLSLENSEHKRLFSAEHLDFSWNLWRSLWRLSPVISDFNLKNACLNVPEDDALIPFFQEKGAQKTTEFWRSGYLKYALGGLGRVDIEDSAWGSIQHLSLWEFPEGEFRFWKLEANQGKNHWFVKAISETPSSDWKSWDVSFYASLKGDEFKTFEANPVSYQANLELWGRLRQGEIHSADALLDLKPRNTDFARLKGHFSFRKTFNRQGFKAYPVQVWERADLALPSSHFFSLEIQSSPRSYQFFGDEINLSVGTFLLKMLPVEWRPKALRGLDETDLTGHLTGLKVTESPEKGQDVSFQFSQAGVTRSDRFPIFWGLSGNVQSHDQKGVLNLEGNHIHFEDPRYFSRAFEPLDLSARFRFKGALNATEENQIRVDSLKAKTAHLQVSLAGSSSWKTGQLDSLRLHLLMGLEGQDLSPEIIQRYLPKKGMTPGLSDWLNHNILFAKRVKNTFLFDGNVWDYPFIHGEGILEDETLISGGSLIPWKDWGAISNIEGSLFFRNSLFSAQVDQASVGSSHLSQVELGVADFSPGKRSSFQVKSQDEIQGADLMAYFSESPLAQTIPFFKEADLNGNLDLALNLSFPLGDAREADESSRIQGKLTFHRNTLKFKAFPLAFKRLKGSLSFEGLHLKTNHPVQGTLWGEPWQVNFSKDQIRLSGKLKAQNVVRAFEKSTQDKDPPQLLGGGLSFASYFSGVAPARVTIDLRGPLHLDFESDFKTVGVGLPPPFDKPSQASFQVKGFVQKSQKGDQFEGGMHFGPLLTARYFWTENRWVVGLMFHQPWFESIENPFGFYPAWNDFTQKTFPLFSHQVIVDGALGQLDVRGLINAFQSFKGASEENPFELQLKLNIHHLQLFSQHYLDESIELLKQQDQTLQLTLEGEALSGQVFFGERIEFNLNHLFWFPPQKATSFFEESSAPIPPLSFKINHFFWKDEDKGQLQFEAFPLKGGLAIEQGALVLPSAILNFKGLYQSDSKQGQKTEVEASLRGKDLGEALKAWGAPGFLESGHGALYVHTDWKGTPEKIDVKTLQGEIGIQLFDGSLKNIENPVINRLMGLFSIESFLKHLSLNFSDMKAKNFLFHELSGVYVIHAGLAKTENFSVRAPNVNADLFGSINVVDKTLDQTIVAMPNIDGGVALAAGLLGGPAASILAWAADKFLVNTVFQHKGVVYRVKESWAIGS